MESNDSPEIPDRGGTSDILGLPSGVATDITWQACYKKVPGGKIIPQRSHPVQKGCSQMIAFDDCFYIALFSALE